MKDMVVINNILDLRRFLHDFQINMDDDKKSQSDTYSEKEGEERKRLSNRAGGQKEC